MLKDLKLSRRSFIKALGALGLVATLPPVVIQAQPLQLPVKPVIDDVVIDTPITKEAPFAWVKLDGEKIAVTSVNLTIKYDFDLDFNSISLPDTSATMCEISFESMELSSIVTKHMHRGDPVSFEISIPGYDNIFVGRARVIEMTEGIGMYSRNVVTSARMNSIGPLMVNFS